MKFRRNEFLPYIIGIVIAVCALNGASYAQFTVTVSSPDANLSAPTGSFNVTATITSYTTLPASIVFYRNDLPVQTTTNPSSASVTLGQNELGEDTYTYRARAYDASGNYKDSNDFKLTVETRYIMRMGVPGVVPSPSPSPSPVPTPPSTTGPNRFYDHTVEIQAAVTYLSNLGGGTLYFPCTGGPATTPTRPGGDDTSIYNISNTITIPSNVTLQGESAEGGVGNCRIYWRDKNADVEPETSYPGTGNPCLTDSISSLVNKPMFLIEGSSGGTKRIRFRDMWLYSRSTGWACTTPNWQVIDDENSVAFAMYGGAGNISDVIFENVSVYNFTYGIKATTCTNAQAVGSHLAGTGVSAGASCSTPETDYEISDVKMRGVRPYGNFRQLYVNGKYIYDWDVQNFNLSGMLENQGAVEIVKSGAPSSTPGEHKKLKFLELNCNGNAAVADADKPFCLDITRHGGLYFKMMHAEGVKKSIIVNDIGTAVNSESIILEGSVTDGEFKDDSMNLYLIGNGILAAPDPITAQTEPHPDRSRMIFSGDGRQSTVFDCGDVHWDRTDVNGGSVTLYEDWKMMFTHSERNRSSFFGDGYGYSYVKSHTVCPETIDEVGGEYFNTGTMPNLPETSQTATNLAAAYSRPFAACTSDATTCANNLQALINQTLNRGTVYIKGDVVVNKTINIPRGTQIVGAPNAEIRLTDPTCSPSPCSDLPQQLFHIEAGVSRTSGIVIRNLKLKSIKPNKTASGIAILGAPGAAIGQASDLYFSGLTIEGFDKGIEVSFSGEQPMIDGASWKNIKFVNNKTAASLFSSRISNWSVMALSMESTDANAVGWDQTLSGASMQNVSCKATSNPMLDCIRLYLAGGHLTGLRKPENVTNALTIWQNYGMPFGDPYVSTQYSSVILRNNDFRPSGSGASNLNITGKYFILSMNNEYQDILASIYSEAKSSRVTYCGDNFHGTGGNFSVLDLNHSNNYVGVPTPTRTNCEDDRPVPWEDAINWGGEDVNAEYQPLAGRFFDNNDDYIAYKKGSSGEFRIRKSGAATIPDSSNTKVIPWGTTGDRPMVGRLLPGQGSQVIVWRPSSGVWYVKDPEDAPSTYYAYYWGYTCSYTPGQSGYADCDVPFIGNFIQDPNSSEDLDEIAIYRPTNHTIYILDPRTYTAYTFARGSDYGSQIQVGDFWGAGYDQIAQVKNGDWSFLNARTYATASKTVNYAAGDVPVAGNYLSDACTEIAVWRPSAQKFLIDGSPVSGCSSSQYKDDFYWGSNNDFTATVSPYSTTDYPNDIPLRMRTVKGSSIVDRPAVYRPTNGVYTASTSRGRWWIHDSF